MAQHPETDEVFLVFSDALTIKMEQGDVHLAPGDTYVVPRSRFHQPCSEAETTLLLFEPSDTVNIGDTPSALTTERRLFEPTASYIAGTTIRVAGGA